MNIDQSIDKKINERIDQLLRNRLLATQSYVLGQIAVHRQAHHPMHVPTSPAEKTSFEDIETLKKQVKKLFALTSPRTEDNTILKNPTFSRIDLLRLCLSSVRTHMLTMNGTPDYIEGLRMIKKTLADLQVDWEIK